MSRLPDLRRVRSDREREFGFTFGDDHRAFLAAGLPVNSRMPPRDPDGYYTHQRPWPDWRDGTVESLHEFLN